MRAAAWLSFKESRASFMIEHEANETDRIKRFAHVIAEHSGNLEEPLASGSLTQLQRGILGDDASLGAGSRWRGRRPWRSALSISTL